MTRKDKKKKEVTEAGRWTTATDRQIRQILQNSLCSGANDSVCIQNVITGAGLGLTLILNVEQYEYMMGPQTDAGVQILLHDQSEFPMIKDLGFAVAPGTHTLVGVNRHQVWTHQPLVYSYTVPSLLKACSARPGTRVRFQILQLATSPRL